MAFSRANFAHQSNQKPYSRRREEPYYVGLLGRGDMEFASDKHQEFSYADFDLEEFFSAEKSSRVSRKSPLPSNLSAKIMPDLSVSSHDNTMAIVPASRAILSTEKAFVVKRREAGFSSVPLPRSAASFYSGFSPQIEVVELCESVKRLNVYLKARKDEITAGVPGKFLHAVIGQDAPDVGSVAATIMYAFYLGELQSTDNFCTVPVINMKRAELGAHADLIWMLDSCQIEKTSLTFMDEIDLSYYDLYGALKLVLVNCHKLPPKQEALTESVVEILTSRPKDCSCCTVIAEKFAIDSPEFLVGKGFSKLLLAGILSDSGNLTESRTSAKDKYMATLLMHGAGRLGANGLYQTLRYKRHDVSDLKVIDILRKDFKRWTGSAEKPDGSKAMVSRIGMSSIAFSLSHFLAHEGSAIKQIKYFQQVEKLRIIVIVSGYTDSKNNFKREILVSAESPENMKNLLFFFGSNSTDLPLKPLTCHGLLPEMRAFDIDKVTSRKTVERLLEEFGGASKG